jgi:hypothetical protein
MRRRERWKKTGGGCDSSVTHICSDGRRIHFARRRSEKYVETRIKLEHEKEETDTITADWNRIRFGTRNSLLTALMQRTHIRHTKLQKCNKTPTLHGITRNVTFIVFSSFCVVVCGGVWYGVLAVLWSFFSFQQRKIVLRGSRFDFKKKH